MMSLRPLGVKIFGINIIGNLPVDHFPGDSITELEGLWNMARTKYNAGNREEGYAQMEDCIDSICLRHGRKARKLYDKWSRVYDELHEES